MNKKKVKYIYIVLLMVILVICVVGATYAYFLSTTIGNNDISASSSNYSISLTVTPIYNDFSLIPMNNSDVFTAIGNQCKDDKDRGACNLYSVNISGYDEEVSSVTGTINTTLNNIQNLSYMVLEKVSSDIDIEDNPNCLVVNTNKYCISKSSELVISGTEMPLGDNSYDVSGIESKELLLAIWLTNLDVSQNAFDIGNYSSIITVSLGDGMAEISGSINATLADNYSLQGGE